MKKDGLKDTELVNNISEIIKTFEDKIILDTKEYRNFVYYREAYSLLKSDSDKNLQFEINKAVCEYKNTISKLNERIQSLIAENVELERKLANNNKHKKHWLWW